MIIHSGQLSEAEESAYERGKLRAIEQRAEAEENARALAQAQRERTNRMYGGSTAAPAPAATRAGQPASSTVDPRQLVAEREARRAQSAPPTAEEFARCYPEEYTEAFNRGVQKERARLCAELGITTGQRAGVITED